MLNIAIFASGGGSNAETIIQHLKGHDYLSVRLIISNRKSAGVLDRAKKHGIETLVIERQGFYENKNFTTKLAAAQIELIVHPALLPKYGGKGMYGHHVHQAVFDNKEKESGPTIHYVNEVYDEGNIILQARCEILPTDHPLLL